MKVFVVGVGRSGTSLLQSMLHAHPDISMLPESHFLRLYICHPYDRWKNQLAGVRAFRSTLATDTKYQRTEIPEEDLLAPFWKRPCAFNLKDVYRRLLRMYRGQENASVVGEKDPRLIDYLPKLKDVCPQARVIHIVRDPRDVLLSRKNAEWSSGRPDWLHVLIYRAQLARGHRQGKRSFGARYMELRYEDLLSDPERVLRNVSDHVGVTYSDAMLAFQRSAEELVHDTERSWKKETTGPLLRDNAGKWRNGLSNWQVCLTERVCSKVFEWFDYERAGSWREMSRAQRIALRLAPIVGTAFEHLYALACRFR